MAGRRSQGTNPRARGTNPRARGTNPRASQGGAPSGEVVFVPPYTVPGHYRARRGTGKQAMRKNSARANSASRGDGLKGRRPRG